MARTLGSDPVGDRGNEGAAPSHPNPLETKRQSLTNVLIIGGTVLQRNRVARTFHDESPLRAGPFVCVDCGTDQVGLREALRAWTSAGSASRPHPFRDAENGTLYLERVEEMPPDTQPLLLALALRLQGGTIGASAGPAAGRLVVGNDRPLTAAVSGGRIDSALHDALGKVQVELGSGVTSGSQGEPEKIRD